MNSGDTVPVIRGSATKALENPKDEAAIKPILDLIATLDSYIPVPKRDVDKPFLMPIEDIFQLRDRNCRHRGRNERGIVKLSDEVEVSRQSANQRLKRPLSLVLKCLISLGEGQAETMQVDVLARRKSEDVERGQVLAKTGSVTPHAEFEGKNLRIVKRRRGRH